MAQKTTPLLVPALVPQTEAQTTRTASFVNAAGPYKWHGAAFATYRHALVNSIVKAAAPESIFLLGLKTRHIKAESIFNSMPAGFASVADAWLLVLTGSLAGKSRQEWQEQIEAHCSMI